MKRLTKQQYKNKNSNAKNFTSLAQLILFQNIIIPKILQGFNDKYKKLWEYKINNILPKNKLNFNTEDEYLDSNKITKNDVIVNSIKYSLLDLEEDDLKYLSTCFSVFSNYNKIKILTKEPLADYKKQPVI